MKRRARRRLGEVVGLLTLLFALAACAESQPSRFYLLATLPPAEIGPATSTPDKKVSVGIDPITFPEYLNRPQIVTRASPTKLSLAEFDRWGEPLKDLFGRIMARNLSALLATEHVYRLPRRRIPSLDYRVEIDVIRFDAELGGKTVLATRWTVFGEDGKQPLVTRVSTNEHSAADPEDFETVVAAMSRAVEDLSREIAVIMAPPRHATLERDLITRIQSGLVERGYDPGPVDGLMGTRTASAIRQYQEEHALLTDGHPSMELAKHIQNNARPK